MAFPELSDAWRIARLVPPTGPVDIVLDTDTYNEVDDQFAVVYALLSPEKIRLHALYAAPFFNNRSSGPADGMEKSYEEIHRLLDRLGLGGDAKRSDAVFRGSTRYLGGPEDPMSQKAANWSRRGSAHSLGNPERACESAAAMDLIARAMVRSPEDAPLYVATIGAITNVASAILMEPEIIRRIVVVWLGGHAFHWPDTKEFNLWQDPDAARVIFDCGVPLVQIPVMGVCSHLHTTIPELDAHVAGRGAIGDYLAETVRGYHSDHFAWSKVIWDISAIAYLLNESWTPTSLVHSPIVTEQGTWSFDARRHLIRSATHVHRDPIFADLFAKLDRAKPVSRR
ncbi:MAG: nucleoside hydrolase [Anaerolineae bacterium]|nr:nucleoside hydrolase [Anaerolineae bacterium]